MRVRRLDAILGFRIAYTRKDPHILRVFAGISYFRGVFGGTWGEWRGIGEIRSEQVVPDENRLGWKKLTCFLFLNFSLK